VAAEVLLPQIVIVEVLEVAVLGQLRTCLKDSVESAVKVIEEETV
jgi:hypothetical protein